MSPRRITDFFHSRTGGRATGFLEITVLCAAVIAGMVTPPAINGWHIGGGSGLAGAVAIVLLVIAELRLINKRFNIMRQETSITGPLLAALVAAVPWVVTTVYAGSMVPPIILCISYVLFSTYGNPGATREIYLAFLLLTSLAFITPIAIYYLPIMLIGLAQMRVFKIKSLCAAVLGVLTPPWIAVGFGFLPPDRLPIPSLDLSWINDTEIKLNLIATGSVAVIIVTGVVMMCGNLYKLMSYNAMTRAYNGFFTLLLMATIILSVIDYYNLLIYIPLLCTLVAYQASMFFVTRRGDRSCFGIMLLMALLWGLFAINSLLISSCSN